MQYSRSRSHAMLTLIILLAMFILLPALTIAQNRGGGSRGGGGNRSGARGQQARPNQNRGARSNNPQNAGNNQPIIITKTDGSTLRVELISFDIDSIQVRNPGERGEFVPIEVAWNDVLKTSLANVTYQKVQDQWKIAHRAELCLTCDGNRVVLCEICRGTHHDPSELPKDCTSCAGVLMTICKGPKCTNGKIPCTNANCLKLTDGKWVDRDGSKARSFAYTGGVAWVSDKSLGHVVTVDPRTGAVNSSQVCPVCSGATILECPVCDGRALVPCQTCTNRKVALCSSDCDKGRTLCHDCGGTGVRRRAVVQAPFSRESLAMLTTRLTVNPAADGGELMHSVAD